MKKNYRIAFVLLITVVAIFVCIYLCNNKQSYPKSPAVDNSAVERELDLVFGNDSANLEMYMYSSYSCVYCRKFLKEVYPKIEKEFVSTGLVKFIIKPLDLSNDANMMHALKTVVCINEYGNFEKLNALLIVEPTVVYSEEFLTVTEEFIEKDLAVAECMLSGVAETYLSENLMQFYSCNFTGTPSFVINNKTYKGFKTYEFIKEVLKQELERD